MDQASVDSFLSCSLKLMPCRLSANAREQVVRLWQQGKLPAQIVREIEQRKP